MSYITQEMFDEAILENEECFDLTPHEALVETVDQFIKQCRRQESSLSHEDEVSAYLGNLLLSHPCSEQGTMDREQRTLFLTCVADLRQCSSQYRVSCYESDYLSSNCDEMRQKIICSVKNIQNFCSPQHDLELDKISAVDDAEPEFASETSEVKTTIDPRRVYLKLFQLNGAMDALISVLRVTLRSSNPSSFKVEFPLIESIVCCIVAVLHQQQYPEVNILVDSFGGWDEITTLLDGLRHLFFHSSRSMPALSNDEVTSYQSMAKLLPKVYQLCHLALKGCEKNKVHFVQSRSSFHEFDREDNGSNKRNSVQVIIQTLDSVSSLLQTQMDKSHKSNEDINFDILTLSRICNTISAACRCDDKRSQVSSSHDHAMEFYRAGLVKVLHNSLRLVINSLEGEVGLKNSVNKEINEESEENGRSRLAMLSLLCSIMSAIRVTCINDEIVQRWVSVGLVRSIQDAFWIAGCSMSTLGNDTTEGLSSKYVLHGKGVEVQVVSDAMGVIRNICASDEIKSSICQDGKTLPLLLIHGMRQFCNVPSIQEHGCGTIAAMALRSPSNVKRMMTDYDVGKDITTALRCHPTNAKVQRQGALAIRNLASRADEAIKEALIDLGVEDLLRNTTGKLSDSVEEAYAALRDLGLQVSMIHYTVDDDGKVIRSGTVQMFGEEKPKFRATFEPTHEDIAAMFSNK